MEPLELWHAIIDGEAAFHSQHGRPPTLLKLPTLQALDLAKLGRDEFGPFSEQVMRRGTKAFEEDGLPGYPGMKVQLVPGNGNFSFQ